MHTKCEYYLQACVFKIKSFFKISLKHCRPRSANSNYLPVYQPDDDDVMVIHHTNLSNDVQVLGEYVGNGVPLHSQRNARDIQRDNGDTNTQQHERGINSYIISSFSFLIG